MRSGVRHLRRTRPVAVPGAIAFALAVAVVVAACGSGGGNTTKTSLAKKHQPKTLYVYASLPLHGVQAAQGRSVLNGIQLALGQAKEKAGPYTLKLFTLDDSGPRAHSWTESATLANARRAAVQPKTILYIGELDSAASAFSIPILNQARIPQISPGSPASDLTGDTPEDAARFRPSNVATFFQLAPDDRDVAAKANLSALGKLGCTRTLLVGDKSGADLVAGMREYAHKWGVGVATLGKSFRAPTTNAALNAYVEKARHSGDCVFYAGVATPQALTLIRSLRAALPATSAVVGSSELCDASWARQVAPRATATTDAEKLGGDSSASTTTTPGGHGPHRPAIQTSERSPLAHASASSPVGNPPPASTTPTSTSPTAATSTITTTGTVTTPAGATGTDTTTTTTPTTPATTGLWCTSPTPNLAESALGRRFMKAYKKNFGGSPDLPAIFGYEAMQVGISAIRSLGSDGDNRQMLLTALHYLPFKGTALGDFTFDVSGGSTVTTYGLYEVRPNGTLHYHARLGQTQPTTS